MAVIREYTEIAKIYDFIPETKDFLEDASDSGKIPYLLDWWEEHQDIDKDRIHGLVDKLSVHEVELLTAMLGQMKRAEEEALS